MCTDSNWIGVQTGVHGFDSPYSTQTCGFKNIWSQHPLKQLWRPDGCRRTLAAKECVLCTQQEGGFKWIDPSERRWIEERWTSRESLMVARYRYLDWRYPIRTYKWFGAMSVMFPLCEAPGPHSSISEEFLPSIILRPKKPLGSWNLVKPSSQNEWSVDGWMCCQITTPGRSIPNPINTKLSQ